MYSCEDRCEVTCEYKGHNLMGEGECQGDNWLLCYSGHCWLVFSYYSIIVFSLVMSLYNFCICSFLGIYGYTDPRGPRLVVSHCNGSGVVSKLRSRSLTATVRDGAIEMWRSSTWRSAR